MTQSSLHPMEPSLDAPRYHEQVRLRGYTRSVCVLSACTSNDGASILRRLARELSKEEHFKLADAHAKAAADQCAEWNRLADKAAVETFGRPFRFGDYKISGIACEEFEDGMKAQLRFAAHAQSNHKAASRAHWAAATRKRYPY